MTPDNSGVITFTEVRTISEIKLDGLRELVDLKDKYIKIHNDNHYEENTRGPGILITPTNNTLQKISDIFKYRYDGEYISSLKTHDPSGSPFSSNFYYHHKYIYEFGLAFRYISITNFRSDNYSLLAPRRFMKYRLNAMLSSELPPLNYNVSPIILEARNKMVGEIVIRDYENLEHDEKTYHPLMKYSGYVLKEYEKINMDNFSLENCYLSNITIDPQNKTISIIKPKTILSKSVSKYTDVRSFHYNSLYVSVNPNLIYYHPDHIRYFVLINDNSAHVLNNVLNPLRKWGSEENEFMEKGDSIRHSVAIGVTFGDSLMTDYKPHLPKVRSDELVNKFDLETLRKYSRTNDKVGIEKDIRVSAICLNHLPYNGEKENLIRSFRNINESNMNVGNLSSSAKIFLGSTILGKHGTNSFELFEWNYRYLPILTKNAFKSYYSKPRETSSFAFYLPQYTKVQGNQYMSSIKTFIERYKALSNDSMHDVNFLPRLGLCGYIRRSQWDLEPDFNNTKKEFIYIDDVINTVPSNKRDLLRTVRNEKQWVEGSVLQMRSLSDGIPLPVNNILNDNSYYPSTAPVRISFKDPSPLIYPFVDRTFKVKIDKWLNPTKMHKHDYGDGGGEQKYGFHFMMDLPNFPVDHKYLKDGEVITIGNSDKFAEITHPTDIWLLSMCNWMIYTESGESPDIQYIITPITQIQEGTYMRGTFETVITNVRPTFNKYDHYSLPDPDNPMGEEVKVGEEEYGLGVALATIINQFTLMNDMISYIFNWISSTDGIKATQLPQRTLTEIEYRRREKLKVLTYKMINSERSNNLFIGLFSNLGYGSTPKEKDRYINLVAWVSNATYYQSELRDSEGNINPLYFQNNAILNDPKYSDRPNEFYDKISGIKRYKDYNFQNERSEGFKQLLNRQMNKYIKPNPEFIYEEAKAYFQSNRPGEDFDAFIKKNHYTYEKNGVQIKDYIEEEYLAMEQFLFAGSSPVATHPDYTDELWTSTNRGIYKPFINASFNSISRAIYSEPNADFPDYLRNFKVNPGENMIGYIFRIHVEFFVDNFPKDLGEMIETY